jgi:hypothetical protein
MNRLGLGFQRHDRHDQTRWRSTRDVRYLDEAWFALLIMVADIAAALGGTVAAVFALGHAAAGRGVQVWGVDVLILVCLLAVSAGLRVWRSRRRRACWRRARPHDVGATMPEIASRDTGFALADVENDFQRALRQRRLAQFAAQLRRAPPDADRLLRLDDVLAVLGRGAECAVGLQAIALGSIVGTVDSYDDFDRQFRPRSNRVRERWQQLALAQRRGVSMPPIEVYRVADVYFVQDGHHRVSIAHATGQTMIDAYVTEVITATLWAGTRQVLENARPRSPTEPASGARPTAVTRKIDTPPRETADWR